MPTKEEARQIVSQLVEKYRSQIGTYESTHYDEANTRRDFLDALFDVLNWDIGNKEGLAQSHRKTILEDKVIVDGNSKAADYAFRDGKTIQFYVEAKKPSVNIKNNQEAVFQLRRYGWSNRDVNISILTNFKEFAVYDCTKQPNVKDKPHVARLTYLTLEDFGETKTLDGGRDGFDFLWDTLEYNNVLCHSLDKYLKNNSDKQGSVTVDEAFLQLLESWREVLAKSVCRTNQGIGEEDLNFAVHEILNRIVFLRMMESRKIETFGNLQRTVESNQCYKKLITLFQRADEKYNSGLFNFDRDKVSEKLTVEDTVLKTMINALYYPCPYDFSQIPVEILGSVYEQFLGKTIRLTASGKNVKVEEKPEVRKAGGVYYTPQYIVDYIVENTVGKLLEGKAPKAAEKIKVVDPACGSGSFLLGAYQFLLDWHKDYYFANDYDNGKVKSKGLKTDKLTPDYQLTATEKKKILLNNIFGVDIDIIAVEVAKLSLLIKCVEGETEASIENTLWLFHEKVLPDIDSNIRDGNSLVDTNFYELDFDPADEKKIKPFHWQKHFPQVFKQGGFDAVIGNPPYVQMSMFNWFGKNQKNYMLNKYCSSMGRLNTFGFFIERGINLLAPNGLVGYIVPNTILTQEYYQEIRKLILSRVHIDSIVSYEKLVFANAVVETVTLILSNTKSNKQSKISLQDKNGNYSTKLVKQKTFANNYKHQFSVTGSVSDNRIKTKIHQVTSLTFQDICLINQAIALRANRAEHLFDKKRGADYKPVLDGREIQRYQTCWAGKYLKYNINAIHSCKREDIFTSDEKIFFRRVSASLIGTLDLKQYYALNTLVVMNKKEHINYNIRFILGVFNSKLINYYYCTFLKSTKTVFSEIQARQIGQIPFPNLDLSNPSHKATHNTIVRMVDELLRLYNEKAEALVSPKLHRIEEKITYCEDKINELVYQLYGLTDEEIAVIEAE